MSTIRNAESTTQASEAKPAAKAVRQEAKSEHNEAAEEIKEPVVAEVASKLPDYESARSLARDLETRIPENRHTAFAAQAEKQQESIVHSLLS
jgi:hypothetical protein